MAKKKRGAGPGAASASPTALIERNERKARAALVQSALAKSSAGQTLSAREKSAVKAWEQEQLDRWGMQLLEHFPKKLLCDLLGVSQKVMLEKSRLFGLGYHTSGKTCQPVDVLRRLLEWTSEHKHGISRLLRTETFAASLKEDDDLDFWQCELVKERTLDIREKREERQGRVVDREVLVDLLRETFVDPIAKKQEQLDRRTGEIDVEEARAWFEELLESIERRLEVVLAEEASPDDDND